MIDKDYLEGKIKGLLVRKMYKMNFLGKLTLENDVNDFLCTNYRAIIKYYGTIEIVSIESFDSNMYFETQKEELKSHIEHYEKQKYFYSNREFSELLKQFKQLENRIEENALNKARN